MGALKHMNFSIYDDVMEFIKENINLINLNRWDEVYKNAIQFEADEENPDGIAPYLTNVLLECDINPLDYMNYIPYGYYCNSELEEFIVPNNIEHITYGTLNLHKCKKFVLPKNLKYLHLGVFDYIGNDGNDSFEIIYDGSTNTLDNFIIDPNSKSHNNFYLRKSKFTIKCNNGILEYGPNPYDYYDDLPF